MATRVLTRPQLRELCGSDRALHRELESGRWVRVLRGAYADTPDDGLAVRAQAAMLVLPTGCVVAGHSALWLCGVDVLPPGPQRLEVLVGRGCAVPRRAGVAARQGLLRAADIGSVGAVPTLRPARAAVDLLRRLRLPDAVAVADAVQHSGLCPRLLLEVELAQHSGLRGVLSARRALELSSPLAESAPESRLRVALVLAGLLPVPQFVVRDPRGRFLARVDLAFPDLRIALEYDGRAAHITPAAFTLDRRRQNALVTAGWLVLRFSALDMRDIAAAVSEVRATVRRARLLAAG